MFFLLTASCAWFVAFGVNRHTTDPYRFGGKINRKHKVRVTHDPHPYQYPYRPDYHLDSEQERKSTPLTKNDRMKLDSFPPFFTISYPVWEYTYTPSFGCTSDERFSSLFDMRGGDMKLWCSYMYVICIEGSVLHLTSVCAWTCVV